MVDVEATKAEIAKLEKELGKLRKMASSGTV